MDEQEEDDILEPSTVSGCEHVDAAGVIDSTKVSKAAASEVQLLGQCKGQAEESTKEAKSESGDQISEGNSGKEEGLAREVKILEVAGSEAEVGGSSVVVESKEEKLVEGGEDSKEANCHVGAGGDSEMKSEVGGPSVIAESKEEELVTATKVSIEADGGVGAVSDLETQNDVDGLSTPAGSKEGKSVEGTRDASGGADGLSTSAGSKEGKSVEGTEGTKEANVDAGADNELRTENEVGSSSVVGESKEDSKDVSEGAMVLAGDEALDPMVLDEETNGSGEDALQGSETKEVDVLHNETQNPATETAFVTYSTIIKDSTPPSKVVEGGAIMMAGDGGLNPRVEGPGANASETPGGVASERIISSSDGDSTSTEKDGVSKNTSNSLGDQTRVAGEGKVASVDDEDIACPNIEDPQSFYQPTEVVVGVEAASKQDKERFNSTETQKVTVEECLDQGVTGDSAQVHSTLDPVMVVGKQVTHVLLAGIQKEQGLEQLEKVEAKSGNAENLGEEKKVEGVHSAVEAVHVSSGTDTLVMDGKENVVTTNARALNSNADFEVPSDNNQQLEVRGSFDKSTASDLAEIDSSTGQEMTVEEHVDLHDGEEMEVEQGTGAEQPITTAHESVKWEALMLGSSEKAHQANYQLPPDNEVEFSVPDLVWGKVRSHPWWPGQIFDPADASEKAMKYYKKDCFLVAYFGDRTFAWNEASLLKPFRSHFSEVEKQSTSETFQNAVDCALEEVSRRVELGLACSCISEDTYDNIKLQIVENTGIRQESSTRAGVDQSTDVDLFEPNKLVEYVKELAQSPVGGADRLQLVIAKSQLLAFYRLKGYYQLPEFLFSGELLENADALQFEESVCENSYPAYVDDVQSSACQGNLQTQSRSYNKRKHNLKESFYPRKKERNLPELRGDSWDSVDDEIGSNGKGQLLSPSSDGKQKGSDSFADDLSAPEGRKTISFAKVSTPKPSFKIGDCIRRVASQMTGSPSILKGSSQKPDGGSDGLTGDPTDTSFQQCEDAEMKRTVVPAESLPLEELLSQLQFAARDPLKGYNSFSIIISFFSDFRNSVVIDQQDKVGGKRRKASQSLGSPETFEFEDMNDTYWRDRFIENGSEEQPSRKSRKRDNHFVPVILDKPLGRSNSRKRYSDTSYDVAEQKPVGYVDEKAPAELVMHFPVVESVPSEINLNKMFKSFGPLREPETEVDRDTNRARVVFKRCSDAEVAYSSAPRFSIFGSTLVNYQLNYVISVPFKAPPIAIAHEEDDPTLFLQY